MYTIFVGGLLMEVNSFNPVYSTREAFSSCMLRGAEVESMRGTALELGGIYDCLDKRDDIRVVPGFFAQACTSGPMKAEEFAYLSDALFESLRGAGPVDGVLLVLHGAMQSEIIDDCEGYILKTVRDIVGDAIPVFATFDFHALMSRQMAGCLDGASGYQTYPHTDQFDTGKRAAEALLHRLETGKKSGCILRRIPLIMSVENCNTNDSPMVPAQHMLRALLQREGVTSGSMFISQPWLDTPELGCSVCLFFDDEKCRGELENKADEILTYIWENRARFVLDMPSTEESMAIVKTMARPVILVDYGDGPNAGGTGDGTTVLKALLHADLGCTSLAMVVDPESTDKAYEVGEGHSADFMIGGFGKPGAFNERIPVRAKVLKLTDEPFVHIGPAQKGFVSRPGRRALLQAGDVYIILCSHICYPHDRNMLLSLGLDPKDIGVISMRATHSFMSTYAGVMGSWIYVDTPGYTARRLSTLPYRRCARPIYPLDDIRELNIIKER